MLPLVSHFEDSIFSYTQLERVGDIAIFQQTHKAGQVHRYEVVKIHIQAPHTWPNGVTTPEKEAYPPASKWGSEGWTCHTLGEAQALAQQLQIPAPPLESPVPCEPYPPRPEKPGRS